MFTTPTIIDSRTVLINNSLILLTFQRLFYLKACNINNITILLHGILLLTLKNQKNEQSRIS